MALVPIPPAHLVAPALVPVTIRVGTAILGTAVPPAAAGAAVVILATGAAVGIGCWLSRRT